MWIVCGLEFVLPMDEISGLTQTSGIPSHGVVRTRVVRPRALRMQVGNQPCSVTADLAQGRDRLGLPMG